jgi:WD40 repeat protein
VIDDSPSAPGDDAAADRGDDTLGDFRLVREIGRGGMGIVYEACQTSLRRRVALKVLTAAGAMDPRQVQRFQVEVQAAATLHHPNIVKVHSVGCERAVHYYAMELIEGRSLADVIAELRQIDGLDPIMSSRGRAHCRAAAVLGIQAAEALEHAHQSGVLHRDIKPSNLLIDLEGKLWVADFGLARIQGDSQLTQTGDVMGTLRYLSPEQALGQRGLIDERADIYALGATLYELLTLRPAFGGDDRAELLSRIAREEPRAPRRLCATIPADLETIVLKAMAKEPEGRYATAQQLADDLRRYLAGEPIQARPPSNAVRLRSWILRHRTLATTAAILALAAVALAALGAWSQVRQRALAVQLALQDGELLDRQKDRQLQRQELAKLEDERRLRQRKMFVSRFKETIAALKSGQVAQARDYLRDVEDAGGYDPHEFVWKYLRDQVERPPLLALDASGRFGNYCFPSPDGRTLVSFRLKGGMLNKDFYLLERATLGHRTTVPASSVLYPDIQFRQQGTLFSPDGRWLTRKEATGPPGQPLRNLIWDVTNGRLRAELSRTPSGVVGFCSLLAYNRLFTLTAGSPPEAPTLELWELRDGVKEPKCIATLFKASGAWRSSRDGRLISAADDTRRRLLVVDVATASVWEKCWLARPNETIVGESEFSADNKVLTFHTQDSQDQGASTLVFWDLASGRTLKRLPVGASVDWQRILYGPDGKTVAIRDNAARRVTLWDRDKGKSHVIPPETFPEPRQLGRMAFSPDGFLLAIGCESPERKEWVGVWDVGTGRLLATSAALGISSLEFSPDGRELIISGRPSAMIWRLDRSFPASLEGRTDEAWSVAFSPDGRWLATGSDDDDPETIKIWDIGTGKKIRGWYAGEGTVAKLAFSPDGKLLVSAHLASKENIRLWDPANGGRQRTLEGHAAQARAVAFSPDGTKLASCGAEKGEPGADGSVRIWDLLDRPCATWLAQRTGIFQYIAFSPDGSLLAVPGEGGAAEVMRTSTSERIRSFKGRNLFGIAFTTDGTALIAADQSGSVTVWDLATGAERIVLSGGDDRLMAMAVSPNSPIVAVAGMSRKIHIWDTLTGQELLTLEGHKTQINGLAFSPDGSILGSCSHDGAVKLWRGR